MAERLIDNIEPQKSESVYMGDPLNIKEWLIKNIDNAFKVWKKSPYASGMGYEEFTQTILPYLYPKAALDVSSEFISDRFYNILHSPDSFNIDRSVRRFNFYTYCADCFENGGKLLGNLGIYNIIQFYQFECSKQSEWTARVLKVG